MRSTAKPAYTKYYDKFYTDDGWKTTLEGALAQIEISATRLGWLPGRRILDLGCGQGLQTEILRTLGFDAVGIDASPVGIGRAKRTYSDASYICADVAEWEPDSSFSFDSIYCRCMSWFHYELNGVNRNGIDVSYEVARFFTWLPSGGEFVLQISTDFSGVDTLGTGGVLNNTLDAYLDLFALFGTLEFVCDWKGNEVDANKKPISGVILATRKPQLG